MSKALRRILIGGGRVIDGESKGAGSGETMAIGWTCS